MNRDECGMCTDLARRYASVSAHGDAPAMLDTLEEMDRHEDSQHPQYSRTPLEGFFGIDPWVMP